MNRSTIAFGLLTVMVLSAGAVAMAHGNSPRSADDDRKVGICHATSSEKNPFVFIVVDRNGAQHGHHEQHERDVIGVDSEDDCPKAKSPDQGEPSQSPSPSESDSPDESPEPTEAPDEDEDCPFEEEEPQEEQPEEEQPEEEEEGCPGDAAVSKSGELADDRIRFTVTVESLGLSAAKDVVLSDRFPDVGHRWRLDEGGDADDCTLEGRNLSCDFGDLDKGMNRSVSVSALHCPADCGDDVRNTATVTASNDGNATNDEATAVVEIEDCPEEPTPTPSESPTPTPNETTPPPPPPANESDVGVEKSAERQDQTVTWTITVTSLGDADAMNVVLTDEIPQAGNEEFLGGDDSEACTLENNHLECTWDSIPSGESRSVTVSGYYDSCEPVTNMATVAADDDADEGNNEASATAEGFGECPEPEPEPAGADVSVTKTVEQANDTAVFTLTVHNAGPDTAVGDGVYLNDSLPDIGSDWFIGGPDSEACTLDENDFLSCVWEEIPANESRTVTATGYTQNVCPDVEIVNTATVWAENDNTPDNNEATAVAHGTKQCADVGVTKTVEPSGDTAVFTIRVDSLGPEDASNVMLDDALPDVGSDWFLGGPDSEACTLEARSLHCEWAAIAAGESRTVTVTAYTQNVCPDEEIVNTATVTADVDTNADNNASTASTPGTKVCADASVNKTASQDDQAVTFTLTVQALGPADSVNVVLHDSLPDMGGRAWLLGGADSEACTLAGNELTCDFGDLAAGASRSVEVKAYTDMMGCGDDLVNTATVTSDNDDNAANDASSASVDRQAC